MDATGKCGNGGCASTGTSPAEVADRSASRSSFPIGFREARGRRAAGAGGIAAAVIIAAILSCGTYAVGGIPPFEPFRSQAGRAPEDMVAGILGTLTWLSALSVLAIYLSGWTVGLARHPSGNRVTTAAVVSMLFILPLMGFLQVHARLEASAAYTQGALDLYSSISESERALSPDREGPLERDVYLFSTTNGMMGLIYPGSEHVFTRDRDGFDKWKAERDASRAAGRSDADGGSDTAARP